MPTEPPGYKYEPFANVRRGGPKESRLYRRALMGEYDYRKYRDETVMERVRRVKDEEKAAKEGRDLGEIQAMSHMCKVEPNHVEDYINRLNITAKPIDRPKKPDPSRASLPQSKAIIRTLSDLARTSNDVEDSFAPIGSPEQARFATKSLQRPSTTQLIGRSGELKNATSTLLAQHDGMNDVSASPIGSFIEKQIIPEKPDVSDRDPFYMTRDGGQKQKRLYRRALMNEFNRNPDKKKLSKEEVDEWVSRSRAELARHQPPEIPKDFQPFHNVRRGGPKEKRLYRTALMGEYDYRKPKDNTKLKEGRIIRDSLTLEMADMPDYDPFFGVRHSGPKEVRLYKRALMGEYDYRKAKDETVLEHVRRVNDDPTSQRTTSHMCRVNRDDVNDFMYRQNKAAEPIVHPKVPEPNRASLPLAKKAVEVAATKTLKDNVDYRPMTTQSGISRYIPLIESRPSVQKEPYKYDPFGGVRRGGPKEKRLYARALMGEYDYRKPRDFSVMELARMHAAKETKEEEDRLAAKEAARREAELAAYNQ